MAVTVTVMFGACWLSDIITHSVDYYTPISISKYTYSVIHTLILLNTAVNPFVYALINRTFREKIKEMIWCNCTISTGSFSPPAGVPQNAEYANKAYQATSFPGSLILPPRASEERPLHTLVTCHFDNHGGVLYNQQFVALSFVEFFKVSRCDFY